MLCPVFCFAEIAPSIIDLLTGYHVCGGTDVIFVEKDYDAEGWVEIRAATLAIEGSREKSRYIANINPY